MKTIKGYITAATMFAVLAFGSTFANAGIIVAGRTADTNTKKSTMKTLSTDDGDPCTDDSTDLGGIIVAGFTAVATYATAGIIVAGATQETCGIIVAG
jgi:hypothetical protein